VTTSWHNGPEASASVSPVLAIVVQARSCHDGVTVTCPVCGRTFSPSGKRAYCTDACKAAAYRRRRDANRPVVQVQLPKSRPRGPITVYECGSCGERSLGDQRCGQCGIFMRRVGIGGPLSRV
jgi:hypothetical protein